MTQTPPRILYLVHDLADAAVLKRTTMLQDGGASVVVAGFRRSNAVPEQIGGAPVVDLGQTFNGGFVQRIVAVIRIMLAFKRYRPLFASADIVIARNLEMLAIGARGRAAVQPSPVLVYESLDIHRLLLNNGIIGKILRGLEGWLSRRAACLITSSPAFIENYFTPLSQVKLPIRLIENKVYQGEDVLPVETIQAHRPAGPPWRIGWFGAIRCRKSLQMLSDLVRLSNGQVEVVIRGKPSLDQFDDFEKDTTTLPGLSFLGPYNYPYDLMGMYRDVHFTWAIDMFEEGQNSAWLLPNRLYEGGRYHAVPLALKTVETGRKLDSLGLGHTFKSLSAKDLLAFFDGLTSFDYQRQEETAMSLPSSIWSFTRGDCVELVSYLHSLRGFIARADAQ